jgi:proteasome lid subunit RPN8/RPN11
MRIEAHLPALAPRLREIAMQARPREAGGVVSSALEIVEMPNRADDPERDFSLGPLHAIEAAEGRPIAIWHTHPADEDPSPQDIGCCTATGIPWLIAGPSKVWAIHPQKIRYVAREFAYGTDDCWQCVADWFACERSIFLPWFPRPPDLWWREAGPSPYLEAAAAYGFEVWPIADISFRNLRVGDVLLMKIAGRRINHAAVYVGGGAILHHLYGALSGIDQLSGDLQRLTVMVGRHHLLAC